MLELQIQANKRKTILLMIGFTLLTLSIGAVLGFFLFTPDNLASNPYSGAITGAIITSVILTIYLPITYYSSSKQVIALSGSKEADRNKYYELYDIVETLNLTTHLPMPKIYVVNDPSPNAFATGVKPEKAGVSVTTGLLNTLNHDELRAVIAHELAHIRNYDIRLLTITIALVSIIVLISQIGTRSMLYSGGRSRSSNGKGGGIVKIIIMVAVLILAPLAAQVVKLAVSRNREYLADATAIEFTRNPIALQNALRKISANPKDVKNANSATASMYIANPLKKKANNRKKKKKAGLFDTHPPIESRIERLERMYTQYEY